MTERIRITQLQEKLVDHGADAIIVTQNVDIFYYTGSMQQGYLVVPAQDEPCFYVRRSVARAKQEAIVPVKELGSFRKFGERLANDFPAVFAQPNSVVLSEFDVLPVQLFQRLQALLPNTKWSDGSKIIREQRMIKSPLELEKMREAARVTDYAFQQALARLKAGMKELELIQIIEYYLRGQGHHGLMRMRAYNQEIITGMVGAGSAAAEPTYFEGPAGGRGLSSASPQGSSRRKIGPNEPILIDIGCNIDGYVIDQTRTAVIGALPPKLQEAYDWCEAMLRKTEALLKPGTVCEDLYFNIVQEAAEAGYSDHFMGYGQDQVKFLGHGIGLEIDELPVLAKGFNYPLQPGMVIAIEPKLTFPGEGVVGIENSYAITDTGFEKLTTTNEGVWEVS